MTTSLTRPLLDPVLLLALHLRARRAEAQPTEERLHELRSSRRRDADALGRATWARHRFPPVHPRPSRRRRPGARPDEPLSGA